MTNIFKNVINSLYIIALFAVVFSACEKVEENDIVETQTNQSISESFKGEYFTPPAGYEDEAKLTSYLANASVEMMEKLIDNYKIAEFLYQENLIWSVKNTMKEGDHFSDIDLTLHLNANQLVAFKSFRPNESLNDRGCASYCCSPCYTRCCSTHPIYGTSCHRYSVC